MIDDSSTSKEEIHTEISTIPDIPDEELNMRQKVLLNKMEYNNGIKIEELEGIYYYDSKYTYFYVVDLDHDGINEICVKYPPGPVIIFHEKDGVVYGYETSVKSFSPVYVDGTFCGSGGSSIEYLYGNISFEENIFYRETITSIRFDVDGVQHFYKGNPSILNEKPGVEISKEEYDKIMSQYPREEATRYDFTIENILKYVE